jgi:hypothetical protein
MISYQKQFKQCADAGLLGKMVKKMSVKYLPFNPISAKRMIDNKTITFVRCLRFGGQCTSSHKRCRLLRGIDE